jgi:hypothetical protein
MDQFLIILYVKKFHQMKKVFAVLGSLLIFAGVKAQTQPTIKKETVVPTPPRVIPAVDSAKAIKIGNTTIKQTTKIVKGDIIKKASGTTLPFKENVAAKPHKG